jgi:succinate dehydrogenase / fumarate reductase cytochrome b subunit
VSILHRVSGAFLFLLIPFIIWALDVSLTDSGFDVLKDWMSSFFVKFLFWLILIPLCFHLVAGLRHLLSDIHIGDSLKGGRTAAVLTFVISALLIILAGIWIW